MYNYNYTNAVHDNLQLHHWHQFQQLYCLTTPSPYHQSFCPPFQAGESLIGGIRSNLVSVDVDIPIL